MISLFNHTATVKENRKEKYEKENGKRVIIIYLFHLMATVKEKRKEKYEKENGKRVMIS